MRFVFLQEIYWIMTILETPLLGKEANYHGGVHGG